MANLRRLSWVDIALVILLVVGAVFFFFSSRGNADLEQEKAGLEIRGRATELDLSKAEKEIDLESLRQSLEQAQSALAESPLPSEAEATAATDLIMQYADENNITIARWDSGYTSISLKERKYSAIRHSLSIEGKADALVSFIEGLTQGTVAPTVQSMDITAVEGTEDLWQMMLELLVYYR